MTDENYRIVKKYYRLLFVIFAAGVAAGGVYYVNRYHDSTDIKDYLDVFLTGAREGMDSGSILLNSLRSYALTYALLFAGVFFRFGGLLLCAEVIRRGFIIGFSSSAFMRVYGAKGLVMAVSGLPSTVFFIPAALLFAAVNAALSMKRIGTEKNFIIFYILFSLVIAATFCIAALCESYLTTIFMRLISESVT